MANPTEYVMNVLMMLIGIVLVVGVSKMIGRGAEKRRAEQEQKEAEKPGDTEK